MCHSMSYIFEAWNQRLKSTTGNLACFAWQPTEQHAGMYTATKTKTEPKILYDKKLQCLLLNSGQKREIDLHNKTIQKHLSDFPFPKN